VNAPIRAAIVCDYLEEGWTSMDLIGEMLLGHFAARPPGAGEVAATRIRPPWRRRAARLSGSGTARNVDRLLNRMVDYPRASRRIARTTPFDVYHIVDHSYAQLVHALPADRTVVMCHDLDTFRCLLDPAAEPRPKWFRAVAGHCLRGMQKAAAVACNSETTRDAILARGLVPAERLHVTYVGVADEFTADADPAADADVAPLLGPPGAGPALLHVGTNIPRKRIDVLLDVFAAVRREIPAARLWKVGGAFPAEFRERAGRLGVADAVVTLPFLSRPQLAAVYRRADLTLLPSDAEGFGLPVAEALACGAPVLAADIPVFREVGADCVHYAPVADVPAWTAAAVSLLTSPPSADARSAALQRARRFRWDTHADRLAEIYQSLCG
jgi:glycosyltransferase involved in cell wall biosynthesis